MRSLAICICATRSYTYALVAQARRVQAAILQCPGLSGGTLILVGDGNREMAATERLYGELLPDGWQVRRITGPFMDGRKNYKNPAQLIIARMRSAAFSEARRRNVDLCLSLDSDVLPQSHALECMVQGLDFSSGFYSVSTCPYPSQGGGDFLAGRGTPEHPILPNQYDDERIIPAALRDRITAHSARLKDLPKDQEKGWHAERTEITQELQSCPAKGDIFFLNSNSGVLPFLAVAKRLIEAQMPKRSPLAKKLLSALDAEVAANWRPKGFRRRGWMGAAYPAIGKGAILPTDWCGFGCTLMNRHALSLSQFDGYDGSGTEDLYIVWKRWHRQNLRINTIPHAPCDHVIRNPDRKKGGFILLQAHHERGNAECVDHLRVEHRPWFQQTDGETFSVKAKKTRSASTD